MIIIALGTSFVMTILMLYSTLQEHVSLSVSFSVCLCVCESVRDSKNIQSRNQLALFLPILCGAPSRQSSYPAIILSAFGTKKLFRRRYSRDFWLAL